jgi:hypothetical protein
MSSDAAFIATCQDNGGPSQQKAVKPSRGLSFLQVLVIVLITSVLVTAANHHLALSAIAKLGEIEYRTVEKPGLRFPYPVRVTQYTSDQEDDDLDTLDTL